MRLSSVPGISGDEGWWGIQALAWLSGRPYEAHTTSGNPTDLFFLIPVALVHTMAPPSFLLLRVMPAFVNLLALPLGFWFVRRLVRQPDRVDLHRRPRDHADGDRTQSHLLRILHSPYSGRALSSTSACWVSRNASVPGSTCGAALLVFPGRSLDASDECLHRSIPAAAGVAAFGLCCRHPWTDAILRSCSRCWRPWELPSPGPLLRHLALWSEYLDQPWLSTALARLTDGGQWLEFAANNARLFNGVTIYHYFSGARPATVPL